MIQTLTRSLLAWATLVALPAHAVLTASTSTDIPAARAAFLAQSTVVGAFDWSSLFDPGAHSFGGGYPITSGATYSFLASDDAVNEVRSVNGVVLSLAPGNWVDGPGFDAPDGLQAAADLAINGTESFDLAFGSAYRSVGLAIATGHSNIPSEVDLAGASFEFTALDVSGQAIGSATLVLPAGGPADAWVTLVASAPMRSLRVREVAGASINDQYFSNIYATPSVVTSVPEPGAWLLMAVGLGTLLQLRGRRGR